MSKDLNTVHLIGRATRDIELRHIPSGTAVADVSLAVNDVRGTGENKTEEVSFVKCVFWGKSAEIVNQYLKKGHRVAVQGRLKQSTWDDKEGNKRSSLDVQVSEFQFLQPKGDQQGYQNQQQSPAMGSDSKEPSAKPFADDDIPFAPNKC